MTRKVIRELAQTLYEAIQTDTLPELFAAVLDGLPAGDPPRANPDSEHPYASLIGCRVFVRSDQCWATIAFPTLVDGWLACETPTGVRVYRYTDLEFNLLDKKTPIASFCGFLT